MYSKRLHKNKTRKKFMNNIKEIIDKYNKNKDKKNKSLKKILYNKKVNFKPVLCNPSKKQDDYTCYTESELIKLRDLWNEKFPDNKINKKNKKEIWLELMKKMKKSCNNEKCWVENILNMSENNIVNKIFTPSAPKSWSYNKNEWLSNYDLLDVMNQYVLKCKDFAFIGPVPIDFDSVLYDNECVSVELCKFEINKYINDGKKKIAIIFNTDPHNKGGSHWISLYIDIKKKYIFFFDSTGNEIPDEIKVFTDRIISQSKKIGINMKYISNVNVSHQTGNTECGMYSLFFIINLLNENVKPDFFIKGRIKDSDVEKFRKIYFN